MKTALLTSVFEILKSSSVFFADKMPHTPFKIRVFISLDISVNGPSASGALWQEKLFIIFVEAFKRQQITDGINIPQILMNRLIGSCEYLKL